MPKLYAPLSTDEHDIIVKFAGKKTSEEIGIMLGIGRRKVQTHATRNKISLRKSGQYHDRAKLTDLQAEMVKALGVAGFSDTEINKACFQHVTRSCISGITTGASRS